jgi:hypothetical protein
MVARVMFTAFALSLALFESTALGQKINQPWSAPRPSVESRVVTCNNNPQPPAGGFAAFDDWVCPATGPLTRVQWWGTVTAPAQLTRRYNVSIWNHDAANCRRGTARLYNACVTPTAVAVGIDCQNRTVYRFAPSLPSPYFGQVVGTHYWLGIAEDDGASVTVGAPDFRWSEHVPVRFCAAEQVNSAGAVTQPLIDACFNQPVDLAFRLFGGVVIVGTVPTGRFDWLIRMPHFAVDVRDPAGRLLERVPVEMGPDGTFVLEVDRPPGVFEIELLAMGLSGMTQTMPLQMGENHFMPPPGCLDTDINGDGNADQDDVVRLLDAVAGGDCP